MSVPFAELDTPLDRLELVCRGCLAESGEMKNMYEWGLSEDYYKITNFGYKRVKGMSELLCVACETTLKTCKLFKEQCAKSEQYLQHKLKIKNQLDIRRAIKNELTTILHDQKLVFTITAPKQEEKIYLPCPYHCTDKFAKKNDLYNHLKKIHNVNDEFEIEIKYYCGEIDCSYHVSSVHNKSFTGRKFLNQHINKMHKEKLFLCSLCSQRFSTETEYDRHTKNCGMIYICQLCNSQYSTNEALIVHLMRKHPEVHKKYKDSKKRVSTNENIPKRTKVDEVQTATEQLIRDESIDIMPAPIEPIEETTNKEGTIDDDVEDNEWQLKSESKAESTKIMKTLEFCDSPKKSFAIQVPEDNNIKNDVTLPSWAKTDFETKTDEISTQTVFEDLLSLKSQNSEDEIFFSESVSLSDIQTQTFPIEFGLSRSNKETQSINSQTESPDWSIKETQTCFCHDSPRPNFRLFDSLSSSPASNNLTSSETQTGDHKITVKSDVMLSFNSAETQTCFDESSNDSM